MSLRRGIIALLVRGSASFRQLQRRTPLWIRVAAHRRLSEALKVDQQGEAALAPWDAPILPNRQAGLAASERVETRASSGASPLDLPPIGDVPGPRVLLGVRALEGGGIEEVVSQLAIGLRSHGITTGILVASEKGLLLDRIRRLGVPVFVAVDKAATFKALAAFQPDVVNGHWLPQEHFHACREFGVSYVETIHNWPAAWPPEQLRLFTTRMRFATTTVAVSEAVARQLRSIVGESVPVKVVPNAVDSTRHDEGDRDSVRARLGLNEEFLFVSLARYSHQKNTLGLLFAFEEAAKKNSRLHLLVAGDITEPLYLGHVQRLHARLRARERIHLRAYCPRPNDLLAAADAFVLNSFWETGPLASVEALLAGTPVLLSEIGEAKVQVGTDPRRGAVVSNPASDWPDDDDIQRARFSLPQRNQRELADAMLRLASRHRATPAERRRLRHETLARFPSQEFLAGHAAALAAAAVGTSGPPS